MCRKMKLQLNAELRQKAQKLVKFLLYKFWMKTPTFYQEYDVQRMTAHFDGNKTEDGVQMNKMDYHH